MSNIEPISEMTDNKKYDLEKLTEYYHKNLDRNIFLYLNTQGIRQETAENFRLGFESGRFGFYIRENSLAEYFEDRIIVPVTNPEGHVIDLVGRALDLREPLYKPLFGVDDVLFNEKAMMDSDEVIFCADILDVLTLHQHDLPAVCIPNTILFKEANADKFAGKRVFLCLTNDETGRRESVRIEGILKDKAMEVYTIQLPEKVRILTDLFVRHDQPLDLFRDLLREAVDHAIKAPIASDSKYLTVFHEEYMKRRTTRVRKAPTGISELDELLNGGLSPGLYMLAGSPNIGKSSLMKRMADHMAAQEQPVVYATWDMTPFELWAISIARLLGTTPEKIMDAELEPEQMEGAKGSFTEMSRMQWTMECMLHTSPDDICQFVKRISVQAGRPPILFVDHFHRLVFAADHREEETEKERQDHMIYRLKTWAKEWNTTIVTAVSVDASDRFLLNSIQATADGILFMEKGADHGDRIAASIKLVKNRNGALGEVKAGFFPV